MPGRWQDTLYVSSTAGDMDRVQAQERQNEKDREREEEKTLNICVIFISSESNWTSINAWTTFDAIKFGIFELS